MSVWFDFLSVTTWLLLWWWSCRWEVSSARSASWTSPPPSPIPHHHDDHDHDHDDKDDDDDDESVLWVRDRNPRRDASLPLGSSRSDCARTSSSSPSSSAHSFQRGDCRNSLSAPSPSTVSPPSSASEDQTRSRASPSSFFFLFLLFFFSLGHDTTRHRNKAIRYVFFFESDNYKIKNQNAKSFALRNLSVKFFLHAKFEWNLAIYRGRGWNVAFCDWVTRGKEPSRVELKMTRG